MAEPKTRPTDASVDAFLASIEPQSRREDARAVAAMMEETAGAAPVMWGPSIVGFSRYTSINSSGKPADWPMIGFSPRKTSLTLYVLTGSSRQNELLAGLGRHTTGKACLYVKKLADIDTGVLKELIEDAVAYMRANYPTA